MAPLQVATERQELWQLGEPDGEIPVEFWLHHQIIQRRKAGGRQGSFVGVGEGR
jgi:hypothetical protein